MPVIPIKTSMTSPVNGYSPVKVSYTANNDMNPNVRKVIDDINNEKTLKAKQETEGLEGFAIMGASIGTFFAFIFLKPEDAVKVLVVELAAFGIYGAVTSNEQKPKIEPPPTSVK